MGMFDEFKTDSLVCNNCKTKINTIQSKEFMCEMTTYYIGDIINMNCGSFIESGYFTEYKNCKNCNCQINIRFYIKENKYIGFETIIK